MRPSLLAFAPLSLVLPCNPATCLAQAPVDDQTVAPHRVLALARKMAPQYPMDPQLAPTIISAKSNFNPQALSPQNAQGLMQLIPETSGRFNVKNPCNPAHSIRDGLAFLRWLRAYFGGSLALIAAYNASGGKVERYQGVPPCRETRACVQRILRSVAVAMHPFDRSVARPSAALGRIRVVLPAR